MKYRQLGVIAAIGIVLALPASSQTTQVTPSKPSPALTAPSPMGTPRSTTSGSSASLLDINSASEADLDKLPGIGKSRATAIIKGRPYHGKDDLLGRHIVPSNVYNGIKDKIIAKQG